MVVIVDPSGMFAYTANAGSNTISAFTIDNATGKLTPIKGSPFSPEAVPFSLAIAGQ
jgi:DNA-binding beta-propeller fold protein YncE